ncbi:hypothetical protein H0W26_05190 [Candidatus Dependentiae bacterium]|nr:hypothetical protein [Candidatus Dependentiae bacterium]
MKIRLSLFLTLVFVSSVYSMNREGAVSPCITQDGNPLSLLELRLSILNHIFKTTSNQKAIAAFKALACVDTYSSNFFKGSSVNTEDFIRLLYTLSYYDRFDMDTLKEISPLLHKEGVSFFEKNITVCDNLVQYFKNQFAKGKLVSKDLEVLYGLKEHSMMKYVASYYFSDEYEYSKAKKNLLVHALDLEVCNEVITFLMECNFSLDAFHPRTPPPLVIVVNKLLEQDVTLKSLQTGMNLDCAYEVIPVEDQVILSIQRLEKLLAMLIEKGASVNSSFRSERFEKGKGMIDYYMTPLSQAIYESNVKRILYFLDKGACLTVESLEALLTMAKITDKEFLTIGDIFLSRAEGNDLLITLLGKIIQIEYFYLNDPIGINQLRLYDIDLKKRSRYLFTRLLEKKEISINTAIDSLGTALLSLAEDTNNSEIAQLLIKKGAINYLSPLRELLMSFGAVYSCGEKSVEEKEEKAKAVLDEVRKLVEDKKITVQNASVVFTIMLTVPLSEETKNLLKLFASREPLSLKTQSYGTITSVFHYMVALVNGSKGKGSAEYNRVLTSVCSLISWLAQGGVKDEITSNGKTAAERAYELDMPELAEHIVRTLVAKGDVQY